MAEHGSKETRRQFLKLALTVSASGLLAACGFNYSKTGNKGSASRGAPGTPSGKSSKSGGGKTSSSGTLVVASFYPLNQTSGWKGLIKTFEDDHPGLKIQTQVTSNGPDYVAKVLAQKASNTMPDVLGVENQTMFPYFQSKGVLLDLTSYLKKDQSFDRKEFYPKIIGRYTVDDRVYGVPYDCQPVCGVFLNKKLFEDAGADLPTGDWTWDQMIALGKKLTKRQGNRTVQYGLDPGGNWLNWIFAYGGRQVDDVDHPTKVLLGSPEAIRGMQAYIDLILRDRVAPSQAGLSNSGLTSADLFTTGKVAMSVEGYWNLVFEPDKFTNLDLGYVMLPPGPAGKRVFQTGGTCYSVSTGSNQKDNAFEFVKYFMGMPGWKAAAATDQPIYPPAYIPAYKQVFMKQKGPNWPVENKDINGEAAQYALFQPRDPQWNEINTKYITPDENLMEQGKKPVAATLKEWSRKFTPMLTANQK